MMLHHALVLIKRCVVLSVAVAAAAPSHLAAGAVPQLAVAATAAPLPGDTPIAIAAGNAHSLALTRNGQVYAWGADSSGQVGAPCPLQGRCLTPTLVRGLPQGDPVTAIAAGFAHSLAVTRSGLVLSWGANRFGQLGDGSHTDRQTPVAVLGLPPADPAIAVAAGYLHSVALTRAGRVYTWGANANGQLGRPDRPASTTAVAVQGLPGGDPVTTIAAGAVHTLALTRAGQLYSWGDATTGQLGAIVDGASGRPLAVPDLPSSTRVAAIAGGGVCTLAALTSGAVYAWGDNSFGQLGHPTIGYLSSVPVAVQGLPTHDPVVALTAGAAYSLSLTQTGRLYAWGQNSAGQLGQGDTVDLGVAAPVGGLPTHDPVVAIAAGSGSSLALMHSGHLYAWGGNSDGQLGIGSLHQALRPVAIGRFSSVHGRG